jgi:hypothetical protein
MSDKKIGSTLKSHKGSAQGATPLNTSSSPQERPLGSQFMRAPDDHKSSLVVAGLLVVAADIGGQVL